jgi:hypothetical protein
VRLRSKAVDVGVGIDGSGRDEPNLGRPKSTLGLGSTAHRINSSIRIPSSSLKDGEETKIERRRSMLWDRSAPLSSGPAAPQTLRHKRSVSAIPGLSTTPLISATRPFTRETGKDANDLKPQEGLGERKTGTGMLLRPRPGSMVLPKRASQVGSVPKLGNSVRSTKPEPVDSTKLTTGSNAEVIAADKRMSKRRSVMYLGQGQGGALDAAPIESKQSREVLLDETGTTGEEVDVESKRQEALDQLMGKGGAGIVEAKKDGTPVPTPLPSASAGTTASNSTTPIHRTRTTASTTRTHERAGSTPVVPRSMRADTPTGPQRIRASIGARPTTGLAGTAKPAITTRARMGVGRSAGDSSGISEIASGAQGRTPVINKSTTPTPTRTPKQQQQQQQPPSTGTTPTKTPSRRDPFNRLRPIPGGSSDTRTRKQSNESDIDFRMEQSSRRWVVESGGADKESPLLGKVGELSVGGGSGGSAKMKRMKSQGSGIGIGGDVFGKPLGMESTSSIKIKELEAQLQALQSRYERERAETLENERKERQRRQVIEAMTDVVHACEEELRILQRDSEERSRQVGLFEKAWEMAVASV